MLARPLASETVSARAVCRLKCSVVANVAAAPWPPPATAGCGEPSEALTARTCSRRPGACRAPRTRSCGDLQCPEAPEAHPHAGVVLDDGGEDVVAVRA